VTFLGSVDRKTYLNIIERPTVEQISEADEFRNADGVLTAFDQPIEKRATRRIDSAMPSGLAIKSSPLAVIEK